jgi:uncharacterized protein
MIYLDTSVIIAAFTAEAETIRVHKWLLAQPAGSLTISNWCSAELSSALSIKVRTNALTLDARAKALANWQQFQRNNVSATAIEPDAFEQAAQFCDQVELRLRAGDALHLAIAAAAGHHIATLDGKMAAAAPKLGVPVVEM